MWRRLIPTEFCAGVVVQGAVGQGVAIGATMVGADMVGEEEERIILSGLLLQ